MNASEQQLLDLVGLIYDSAMTPGAWSDFLGALIAVTGASSGAFLSLDPVDSRVSRVYPIGRDQWYMQRLKDYYFDVCPYKHALSQLETGDIFTTDQLVSDAELVRTEYYNDYLLPQDIYYHAAVIIDKVGSNFTYIDLQRPKAAQGFGTTELSLLRQLLPHLQRANLLNKKLVDSLSRSDLLNGLFDRLSVGILLIDEVGDVVFVNAKAEALLRSHQEVTVRRGRVFTARSRESALLAAMIHEAVATGKGKRADPGGTLGIRDSTGKVVLNLFVTPFRVAQEEVGVESRRVCAAVMLSETDREIAIPYAALKSAYGLTPAEARVARALVNGRSLDDYAADQGVSYQTARSQLKAALHKTDTSRQAELVRKLLLHPVTVLGG